MSTADSVSAFSSDTERNNFCRIIVDFAAKQRQTQRALGDMKYKRISQNGPNLNRTVLIRNVAIIYLRKYTPFYFWFK